LFDQNRSRATKRKRPRRTLRGPFYIPDGSTFGIIEDTRVGVG
jgi:hypothetical protein